MPAPTPVKPPAHPGNPKHARIFGWVMVILGLPMLVWGVWFFFEARASASWPSVQGTIIGTDIRRETHGSGANRAHDYKYIVRYRYRVGSTFYNSDSYAMGHGNTAGRAPTRGRATREAHTEYPRGDKLPVYYDPDDHSIAVLLPGASGANWGIYAPTLLGLFFAGFGIFVLRIVRRSERTLQADDAPHPAA